ncbi:MAG: glucose-6-phosphate dehydrogenase, partial [Micrococcales bacterium]
MSPARVSARHNPLRDPRDRRIPRIAGPCMVVLFGITGDLSRKKVMPALYDLFNRGLLPPGFTVVGYARLDDPGQDVPQLLHDAVAAGARTQFSEDTWRTFAEGVRFVPGEFGDDEAFAELARVVGELGAERGTGGNTAFYLSIPPRFFDVVCEQLAEHGLARPANGEGGWRRVVIEKPFGHDEASARRLNQIVEAVFDPDCVFRIDHYLGKETVQNLLALRFSNQLYEPIWNANYVDHVQITMAEDIGIGGRAGYYDGVGAARDVIQNHLLQLLALVAMEEPVSFAADHLRAEKEKVLSAVQPPTELAKNTARGRYGPGWQGAQRVPGFLDEDGIAADSSTETYAAVTLFVGTRRWAGVPFYLRTGKRLPRRVTEIAVVFKKAPHLPFENDAVQELGKNTIVIRVQPDEGVTIRFGSKVPGARMELRDVTMDFSYGHSFTEASPEAYERLILDVLLGDPPLFPRHREVELSWRILDPVLAYWQRLDRGPQTYPAGTWGPAAADEMLARRGH